MYILLAFSETVRNAGQREANSKSVEAIRARDRSIVARRSCTLPSAQLLLQELHHW